MREYWLVDPELDAVQVFRPTLEGRLARVVELTAEDGDVLTTPLLPGCQIDVRELFRKHIQVVNSLATGEQQLPAWPS